jgi:hypothetical protein
VLEEFSIDKSSKREGDWTGRADLWFSIGRTEYVIEAKQVWVSISPRATKTEKYIIDSLKNARSDAANSRYKGAQALGMTFAVPYLPPSQIAKKEALINRFLQSIKDFDYDFMSYAFPYKAEATSKNGYLYPGVTLIARVPRRKSRSF